MRRLIILITLLSALPAQAEDLRINQIQFVSSHNSYKQAMSPFYEFIVGLLDANAVRALEYEHLPIEAQLDLGMRVLEIDIFFDAANNQFPVGHVQRIDMNTHCLDLRDCLTQIRAWSDLNPNHIPIWIMFNAKDAEIDFLPTPDKFTRDAFDQVDHVLESIWPDRVIKPEQVQNEWPLLNQSRGKVLFLLDESGEKLDLYRSEKPRTMFYHDDSIVSPSIKVINDPVNKQAQIKAAVTAGHMVRTRSDADTLEARRGDTSRRDAAFSSGAQAISTDYYLPAEHFGTGYQVILDSEAICNPVTASARCNL